jgi:hypothetical protein
LIPVLLSKNLNGLDHSGILPSAVTLVLCQLDEYFILFVHEIKIHIKKNAVTIFFIINI